MNFFKKKIKKDIKGKFKTVSVTWDEKSQTGNAYDMLYSIRGNYNDNYIIQFIRERLSEQGTYIIMDDEVIKARTFDYDELCEMLNKF